MKTNARIGATALLVTGLAVGSLMVAGPARSLTVASPLPVPTSLHVQNTELLGQIAALAGRPGPVGAEARQLHGLLAAHVQHLEEAVLPPLTLLPALAAGEFNQEMKWALPLAERAAAGRTQETEALAQITDQLVRLFTAAQQAEDAPAAALAQNTAAWLQNETDVTGPAAQLVARYLRLRFASAS